MTSVSAVSGLRSLTSTLLAVLACALAVVAISATWMHGELMDTDRWTATSVEALRDPQVQELAAAFLADQLVAQQETVDGVREALPPALQGLSGTATAVLRRVAERAALEALRARALEDLWADASRTTHEQFVRWIRGQDVRRSGDVVTLDLQPAVERLARRVGIADGVITAATVATGGAEVRLVSAGQFDQTRRDAHRLEQAATLTAPLALLVAVLSILVAPRRRRALVRVGLAAGVAGLVIVLVAPQLEAHLRAELIDGGAARPVARTILASTTPSLITMGWVTAIVGAAIAGLAALTLRLGRAVRVRHERPMDRPRTPTHPAAAAGGRPTRDR